MGSPFYMGVLLGSDGRIESVAPASRTTAGYPCTIGDRVFNVDLENPELMVSLFPSVGESRLLQLIQLYCPAPAPGCASGDNYQYRWGGCADGVCGPSCLDIAVTSSACGPLTPDFDDDGYAMVQLNCPNACALCDAEGPGTTPGTGTSSPESSTADPFLCDNIELCCPAGATCAYSEAAGGGMRCLSDGIGPVPVSPEPCLASCITGDDDGWRGERSAGPSTPAAPRPPSRVHRHVWGTVPELDWRGVRLSKRADDCGGIRCAECTLSQGVRPMRRLF